MKQVLYRAYRPINFDEIYGQDHIISILKNQIKNNSISHAYLFCGPRGTGKTSTARIFAKELNNGSELDIIELDAASHNKVEDMREIVEKLNLAPFESKYKIYILDEVHMLSQAAFNAFLKSLEEPPPHIIFILATTEPNKLPQTILSRTQRFDFNKIPNEQIKKRLIEVLQSENINYTDEALSLIVQKSDGGLRDALGLLDKVISYGEINIENISQALGIFSKDIYLNIIDSILSSNTTSALEILAKVDESGIDPKVFTGDLISNLKDAILIKNKIEIKNEVANLISNKTSDSNLAFMIEELGKTLNALRYSPNPKIELLASVVSLCNVKFENIAMYKNFPANFQNEILRQNSLIGTLEAKIIKLEEKLQKLSTYPQNSVDNPIYIVDNSKNNDDLNTQNEINLSTEENKNEVSHSKFAQIDETSTSIKTDSNPDLVKKIEDFMPQIKQKLREMRKLSVYSVFEMSKAHKYENGVMTFVFEGESRKMVDIMKKSNPENFIDPILSELFSENIITEYITDEEIESDDETVEQKIENKIKNLFPEANFRVEN